MKISFKLAAGVASLRHALPGGRELALDGTNTYTTDDPAEIAALDRHPHAKRATAPAKKKKAAKPTTAAPAPEEASA